MTLKVTYSFSVHRHESTAIHWKNQPFYSWKSHTLFVKYSNCDATIKLELNQRNKYQRDRHSDQEARCPYQNNPKGGRVSFVCAKTNNLSCPDNDQGHRHSDQEARCPYQNNLSRGKDCLKSNITKKSSIGKELSLNEHENRVFSAGRYMIRDIHNRSYGAVAAEGAVVKTLNNVRPGRRWKQSSHTGNFT